MNEILLGHSLSPDLRVSIERGAGSVAVSAQNLSPLPSILSRTMNWIEVDLDRPGVRDIRPGGFDRYEVFTAGGRRMSLGRAQRVRFYETLVGPFEKIAPAVIVTLRPPPDVCCRFRLHLLAAAGPEVAADWQNTGGSAGGRSPGRKRTNRKLRARLSSPAFRLPTRGACAGRGRRAWPPGPTRKRRA